MASDLNFARSVALFAAAVAAVDAAVFLGGASRDLSRPADPPGWVVGAVWVVLFAGLGAARWRAGAAGDVAGRRLVDALALLCLAYPAYTLGFSSRPLAIGGNLATALLAAAAAIRLARHDLLAGALVFPLVPWLAYATATLFR